MRAVFTMLMVGFVFSGCATWSGIKEDASDAAHWSKKKVNQGAEYVKEKTD